MVDSCDNYINKTYVLIRKGSKRKDVVYSHFVQVREVYQQLNDDALVDCMASLEGTIIIPTLSCMQTYLPNLVEVSNHCKYHILFVQTCIKSIIDNRSSIKNYSEYSKLLRDTVKDINHHIFYNELHHSISSQQNYNSNESRDSYVSRLYMNAVTTLLHNQHSNSITVVAADDNDPYITLCNSSSIGIITMKHLLLKVMEAATATDTTTTAIVHAMHEKYEQDAEHHVEGKSVIASFRPSIYAKHLSIQDINTGIQNGVLYTGRFNTKYTCFDGIVTLASTTTLLPTAIHSSIIISGKEHVNRALDTDTVVVQLLHLDQWVKTDSNVVDDDALVDITATNDDSSSIDYKQPIAVALSLTGNKVRSIPTGRIAGILKRKMVEVVATIPDLDLDEIEGDTYVLAIPMNRLVPKVRVRAKGIATYIKQRVIISIDSWSVDSMYPNGHISKVIGHKDDWETTIKAILIANSIDSDKQFSLKALSCLPQVHALSKVPSISDSGSKWIDSKWIIPEEMLVDRKDLRRSRAVFSIDPPGCQDIDDAMHVHWTAPGLLEIGVSIADVTAFVTPNTALDVEARSRATTVYLPHKRIDMLPSLLSSDIASLHANKDRLAFSIIWQVKVCSSSGRLLTESDMQALLVDINNCDSVSFTINDADTWIGRSVIHSVAAMTYDQGTQLIEKGTLTHSNCPAGQAGQNVEKQHWLMLASNLKLLTLFGRHLKSLRNGVKIDHGAEVSLKMNPEDRSMSLNCKEDQEINETVAELMILANTTAAAKVLEHMPNRALLRSHASTSDDKLRGLVKMLSQLNIDIDPQQYSDLNSLRNQVDLLLHKNNSISSTLSKDFMSLLDSMITRTMYSANYGCSSTSSDMTHSGLGLNAYTHFTSPIRRYADIVVHRQLLRVIEMESSMLVAPNTATATATAGITAATATAEIDDGDCLDDLLDDLLGDVNSDHLSNLIESPASTNDSATGMTATATATDDSVLRADVDYSSSDVDQLCTHLNERNRSAKKVQWDCDDLFLAIYFSNNPPHRYEAIVTSLHINGFVVYIPTLKYTGTVYLTDTSGVVTMHPSALGLSPTSRIAAANGDGETTELTLHKFLNHTCVLVKADKSELSSLRIQQNDSSHSLMLVVRPMQNIQVLVSKPVDDTSYHISQLQLTLVGYKTSGSKSSRQVSTHTQLLTKGNESLGSCSSTTNASKVSSMMSTLFERFYIDDRRPRLLTNKDSRGIIRHALPGFPGRISYGIVSSSTAPTAPTAAAAVSTECAAMAASNTSSVESEWAPVEDLPDMLYCTSRSEGTAAVKQPVHLSRSDYSSLSSRQNKLKTAKRKDKMYS